MIFSIYALKLNDFVYVGLTTKSIEKRLRQHICCLNRNKHRCKELQDSFNLQAFSPSIELLTQTENREEAKELEKEYINKLSNVSQSRSYCQAPTELGMQRQKSAKLGRKQSEEHCKAISNALAGKPKPWQTVSHNKGKQHAKTIYLLRKGHRFLEGTAADFRISFGFGHRAYDLSRSNKVYGYEVIAKWMPK